MQLCVRGCCGSGGVAALGLMLGFQGLLRLRAFTGYVKSFALRNIKVAWQLQGPLTVAGSHQSLAPWTEHEPSDLLPLQQPVMRLGQPVYVDVHRVHQTESPKEEGEAATHSTADADFGSACYTVGVVDRLHTSCTVLWETGSVETNVGSYRLTPVALDRTPLAPTDCQLAPLLLPHMVVQRRRSTKDQDSLHQQDGSRTGPPEEAPKLPWWLNLHFGGLQVGGHSSIDPHLVIARQTIGGARVYKELAFALGADEGTAQGRVDHAALLQAAAARRQGQQQESSTGHTEGATFQASNGTAADSSSRVLGDEAGPPGGSSDRGAAYEAAKLSLPLLLRFMTETDVTYQMLEVPSKRLPLLRRGSSALGSRPPRSPGGALVGEASQGASEDSPAPFPAGPHDVQADEASLVFHEAQALAAEIFSFEGGPSLEAVASFLHLVYSHGQWGGAAGEAVTERNLQQIFEAVALVLGDAGREALMDSAPHAPQHEGSRDVDLGIVAYVNRKEKRALVAWIKDKQQFSSKAFPSSPNRLLISQLASG